MNKIIIIVTEFKSVFTLEKSKFKTLKISVRKLVKLLVKKNKLNSKIRV